MAITYLIVAGVSGVLFGVLDGVINANPLAQKLLAVYQPIARPSVNAIAGILIDLTYGFVMAGLFVILYEGLPGATGLVKGISFALVAWFFRVVMQAASQWIMFIVPKRLIAYTLATGLGEMLVLGFLYGLTLSPAA